MTASATLLRREAFGGAVLRDGSWLLLPAPLTDLVVAARGQSLFDAFFQDPGASPYTEADLATHALELRRGGVLDERLHCALPVIDRRPPSDDARGGMTAPFLTHVQLTRACNLRCAHCFVDVQPKRDPDELSLAQLDGLFAELSHMGAPLVILAGGEPMVRPDFWDILASARAHSLQASLCTNGTLMDEEKAARLADSAIRWFSVSLDGWDEESHAVIRGPGRFEQALDATRMLKDAGVPEVQVRVTVCSANVEHLLDFAEPAARSGAHKIAFKPFRRTETGLARENPWLDLDRARYMRALDEARAAWPDWAPEADFDGGTPERTPDWTGIIPSFGCVGGTTMASVMFDGRVVSCGFVLEEGDWSLHSRTFAECWTQAPTIRAWRGLSGNEACTTGCDNFARCGGGCRARARGAGQTMNDKDPWADCSLKEPAVVERARRGLPVL